MDSINNYDVNVAAIAKELSDASHAPRDPNEARTGTHKPYIVHKSGNGSEVVTSLESLLGNPTRKRGEYKFADANSFTTYVKKHQSEGTELYGSLENGFFKATFDDHSKEVAGWCEHRAYYTCLTSAEWKTWEGNSGTNMSQAQFAQFIEDNLPDIIEPSGADMLEISRSLEAKTDVKFKSSIRLSDGSREFNFEEKTEGSSGKLKVPEIFKIAIPVFTGGAPYMLEARLRFRIREGALSMWYELVRPHKTFEDAVKTAWDEIAKATEMTILHVE